MNGEHVRQLPERTATPSERLPEVPVECYGPDAKPIPCDVEDWEARALAAEADLDHLTASEREHLRQRAIERAEAFELELERIRATLPGLRDFLHVVERTTIRPVSARARMWANTVSCLIPDENDHGAGQ